MRIVAALLLLTVNKFTQLTLVLLHRTELRAIAAHEAAIAQIRDKPNHLFITLNALHIMAPLEKVLTLYVSKHVSLSKAAELAGMTIWEFIDILKNHQIPWGEYAEESAAMDDKVIQKILC